MPSLLIWVSIGVLIGALSSSAMQRDTERGALVYVLIGAAGGFVGGVVFDGAVIPQLVTFGSVFAAVVGAALALVMAKIFLRPAVR